jgi:hypothetical protein
MAAHRADPRPGLAEIAAKQQQIHDLLHICSAEPVLGDPHAVDDYNSGCPHIDGRHALQLFARQPAAYRDTVLPPAGGARLAVELASPFGWHRWVGTAGEVLGIERFGASAPYERILQEFGFTAENVAARARAVLARVAGK